jgi:hypothetical protein
MLDVLYMEVARVEGHERPTHLKLCATNIFSCAHKYFLPRSCEVLPAYKTTRWKEISLSVG